MLVLTRLQKFLRDGLDIPSGPLAFLAFSFLKTLVTVLESMRSLSWALSPDVAEDKTVKSMWSEELKRFFLFIHDGTANLF